MCHNSPGQGLIVLVIGVCISTQVHLFKSGKILAAGWGDQHVGEQHHSRPRLGKAPCKHFMGC